MEACSSYFLPRLIGFSRAMYLVSTGAVFPPTSKHFGDLFAETLPDPTQVLPRALELAADIAENVSPLASHMNQSLMWRGADSPEGAHLLDSSVIGHMFAGKYVPSAPDVARILTLVGTRRRVSRLSSRRGSPTSRPRSSMMLHLIILGGRRLTPGDDRLSRKVLNCDTTLCSLSSCHLPRPLSTKKGNSIVKIFEQDPWPLRISIEKHHTEVVEQKLAKFPKSK